MPEVKNRKFILTNDTTVIIDIHPYEMELLQSLRNKFKFGEVTIVMKDGLPVRWKRITEFDEPNPIGA